MSEAIVVALISGGLTFLGVLLTNSKAQAEADARQEEQLKAFEKAQATYEKNQADRIAGLDRRFEERIEESNRRIDELADEVREHNGYARRMPVVEEQIKVANHRIDDLEQAQKGAANGKSL